MTRLRMKLKIEQETSKGQEKANKFAEGTTSSKPTKYTGKKAASTKIPKAEKNHRNLLLKQKVLEKYY